MQRAIRIPLRTLGFLACSAVAFAQTDPVPGNWRGTLKSADGVTSTIIITMAKTGDAYSGSTTGVGESSEIALKSVTVTGTRVALEASADSKLGSVTLAGDLTVEGNALSGAGSLAIANQKVPVIFDLQRRARRDVLQHQVPQRVDYFVGRWKFEYLGGEFPPLSTGERIGSDRSRLRRQALHSS